MEMLETRRNDVLVLALKGWMRFRRRLFGTTCRSGSIRASGGLQWTRPGSLCSGLRLLLQVAKQLEERSGRIVVYSPGARKACFKNCRFYVAIQHFQLAGGSHSGLPARLALFK